MKKFDLKGVKGVLSSLRGTEKSSARVELEVTELLQPQDFQYAKLMRHGFPFHPTAIAWDPVQRLLAIGTKHGAVRLLGQPSVDYQVQHESEVVVLQIVFLVNEGAFITACSDNSIHLWNFRQKIPEIVHSVKFSRESLTCLHLPFQSKWLYVGTERGNVHIVNIESFTLSGYTINWNKAIDLSQKAHPGPVVHLSDNPVEPNRLLIGFESGFLVLWDLKNKEVEFRYHSTDALRDVDWHHEGRQFMCAHTDGSIAVWNCRSPAKPASVTIPHQRTAAAASKDASLKLQPCKPITRLRWLDVKEGEPYILFSGGLSYERSGKTPSLTLMHGKNVTVLELDHTVIDFVVLCNSVWAHECEDPYAVIVLLSNDLIMVDLTSAGYPCFENPYSMDVHESPVTCMRYYADCASSLIPALYSCGTKQRKKGFSDKEFPISGGHWGAASCSYSEMLITGHADGSLKFWDSCGITLQYLYKVSSSKLFEKQKSVSCSSATSTGGTGAAAGSSALPRIDAAAPTNLVGGVEDALAVQYLYLDEESRILATAGPCHVVVYHFSKVDSASIEPQVLKIQTLNSGGEYVDDSVAPDEAAVLSAPVSIGGELSPRLTVANYDAEALCSSLAVKAGAKKWTAGYQPDMVCLLQWSQTESVPPQVTCMALNSSYNLLSVGTTTSVIVIDMLQRQCILNVTPASTIYGNGELMSSRPTLRHTPSKKSSSAVPTYDEVDSSAPGARDVPLASGGRSPAPIGGTACTPPEPRSDTCGSNSRENDRHLIWPAPGSASRTVSEHPKLPTAAPETGEELKQLAAAAESSLCPDEDSGNAEQQSGDAAPPTTLSLITRQQSRSFTSLNEDVCKPLPAVTALDGPAVSLQHKQLGRTASTPLPPSCAGQRPPHLSKETRGASDELWLQQSVAQDFVDGAREEQVSASSTASTSDDSPSGTATAGGGKNIIKQVRKLSLKVAAGLSNLNRRRMRTADGVVHGGGGGAQSVNEDRESADGQRTAPPRPDLPKFPSRRDRDKAEKSESGPFSQSYSSSLSSLDNIGIEGVQCLVFADAFTKRQDSDTCPGLWIGTSCGFVIVMNVNLPGSGEQRLKSPVVLSPSGTVFRMRGSLLDISFLDCKGLLIPAEAECWKDKAREAGEVKAEKRLISRASRQQLLLPSLSATTSSLSPDVCTDRQIVVMVSDVQVRTVALPSQTVMHKAKICEGNLAVKADVIIFKDSVCLACLTAAGSLMMFSLPSLRILYNVNYFSPVDVRVAKTLQFGNHGHAVYMVSPTEMQKVTLSSEMCRLASDMMSDLFVAKEAPEPPKQSFFKNLFNVSPSILDREELFGIQGGKASRSVAQTIPGTAATLQQAQSVTSEIGRARLALDERGEKLGQLDDRTAMMRERAQEFAQRAHGLSNHFKDKKWYQF